MTASWLFDIYRSFTLVFFAAHADFAWVNIILKAGEALTSCPT